MGLSTAIKKGNEVEVTRLLDENPALLTGKHDETELPLIVAVKAEQISMVMLLQRRGVDVNQSSGADRQTALHHAARGGREEIVAFLLSKGANASIKEMQGWTPLVLGCMRGNLAVVETLLQHMGEGVLDDTDHRGGTALHFAAANGHAAVTALLLSKGAQIYATDDNRSTPLMDACSTGRLDVVQMLLQHGATQGLEWTDRWGRTAMHNAADKGYEDVVACLLDHGAKAAVTDAYGKTPLMEACTAGPLSLVNILAQHMEGQGLDSKDDDGRTALHRAAKRGHADMVACLLSHGAKTTITDTDGKTPLMEACSAGHLEAMHRLVQHMDRQGLEMTDWRGRTALHRAAEGRHEEVVRALLLAGADSTARDKAGATPRAVMREPHIAAFDVSGPCAIYRHCDVYTYLIK